MAKSAKNPTQQGSYKVDEVETLRKKPHERIQDLKKSKKEFLEKFFDRRYSRQSN